MFFVCYDTDMRLLGIDYGAKRIGIALSDTEQRLAFPHDTLINDKQTIDKIVEVCGVNACGGVVMGDSKDFNQEENPIMEEARAFAVALEERTKLPVYFEQEFMTTIEARKSQEKKGEAVDASAAALILQSYLDRQGNISPWIRK